MKLQHKLTLYNTATKIAIITILGLLIIFFTNRVSLNHLQQRLIDKRDKLVANLSDEEIEDLLKKEASFTDYNILKEEYIILTLTVEHPRDVPVFTQELREIDQQQQEYLIISDVFVYQGRVFKLEIGETMEAVKQLESTILYFMLVVLIAATCISLFADLAFTRLLLAPFYYIIEQKLNRVDDPIHYNYTPTATSTDDFKLLDSSIGTLMKKLSNLFATQKHFISNISHEMLTPIAVLRTRMENLLNDPRVSEESQNKIAASLKTLDRMKSVVNSLLLISKVENNQFNRTDEVAIGATIREIFEELEDRMEVRAITPDVKLDHQFHFSGNHALMHTLCLNVISNAIKYNKTGGSIFVTDEMTDHEYRVTIADEGAGMAPEDIEKAFNRFEKLGTSGKDSHGLGLAIAKSIATFHQAGIAISSEKSIGTAVTLSFPVAVLTS
ncbi:sensor histidine kinase [Hufsiella ginkgonis]|uniref:histidine kinase n=1 Tax=Hufsiella ginkgonis TaxID=2695274 RepID=A0A7K1Y3W4_9SPHI|nr:HAMP domain-containing sensor histidine kinase [Hufsiella ginkgonis]MXV17973.1 sensor histidine kinase [Hufsiella ginkgonis]